MLFTTNRCPFRSNSLHKETVVSLKAVYIVAQSLRGKSLEASLSAEDNAISDAERTVKWRLVRQICPKSQQVVDSDQNKSSVISLLQNIHCGKLPTSLTA